jgi:DNA-binding winged helix-turn-helix (wHTH) protein/tetratricopeptide (TPR) repeat protein
VRRFTDFEIDQQRAELRWPSGKTIRLRPKSFAMLQYFAANAGRIVSKQELMESVWPNVHVSEDSLFQCIREIRNIIGDERRQLIKAVSGRGYLFDAAIIANERLADVADPVASQTDPVAANITDVTIKDSGKGQFQFGFHHRMAAIAVGVAACAIGFAIVAPLIGTRMFPPKPPIIAVTSIVNASAEPEVAQMAENLTDRLVVGLAKIPTIRILAPESAKDSNEMHAASTSPIRADLVLRGDLQKTADSWDVQVWIVDASTDEVRWMTSYSVNTTNTNSALQQSRLAAGIGYPLALRISALIHSGMREGKANIVIDQATAFINRTSHENFKTAQEMLEKALAADPNSVDLQAALAAQLLRGIQLVWYSGADAEAAERAARNLLERAVRTEPNYIPVLEGSCRFLTATNHFVDSMVTCAKTLSLDPWDGVALFQIGMSQLQLGRFNDALATFLQADHFDTPQVSRWTWLLGAGLTYVMMDRNEEALPWLKRSLAITPGTGRTHFVLAAAYQRLGRFDEAKAAIAAGMKLRPGSNADNVSLPEKNASPVYLERSEQIKTLLVAAGLPQH